ncbi:glutathione S-transferase [Arenimonas soli]|uniref:Glutathione S-transferase n=1 Tax=Arenimonas soli TaxID=2269504 RepID=A0ABQ1HCG5_9GAMM|nr:MAPEG family protein [Arenimonas soli]GGA69266.1 glutathione S-transferase [Arenimonas soli]
MITLLYAALCTLFILGLAIRVMLARGRLKVGLGDGGHGELNRRVRAHSNAVEYVPLALILLGGMELNGYPDWLVHTFGATLVVSRLLHAWGLAVSEGRSAGRFWGTLLTLLLMVAMCVMAIVGFAAGYSEF